MARGEAEEGQRENFATEVDKLQTEVATQLRVTLRELIGPDAAGASLLVGNIN
jgi:hypothetical protein